MINYNKRAREEGGVSKEKELPSPKRRKLFPTISEFISDIKPPILKREIGFGSQSDLNPLAKEFFPSIIKK